MYIITKDLSVIGPYTTEPTPTEDSLLVAGSAEALVALDRASMNKLYRAATGKEVSAKWPSQRTKGARALWRGLGGGAVEPAADTASEVQPESIHVYVRQVLGFILALGYVPANVREPMLRKLDDLVTYTGERGAGQPAKLKVDESAARITAFYRAYKHMAAEGFTVDDNAPKPARVVMTGPGGKGFINQYGEVWINGEKVARYSNSPRKERLA